MRILIAGRDSAERGDGAVGIFRRGSAACGVVGEGRSAGSDRFAGSVGELPRRYRGGGGDAGGGEEEQGGSQTTRRAKTAYRTARRCGCSARSWRRPG